MTEEKREGRAEALLRRLHFHPAHLIAGIVLLITGISMAISFTMLVYYEETAWRLRIPETFDAFAGSRDCKMEIQFLMGPFASSENDRQHYYWGFSSDMYPAIIMIPGELPEEYQKLLDFSYGDSDEIAPPIVVRGRSLPIENVDLADYANDFYTAMWNLDEMDRNEFYETVATHYLDATELHGLEKLPPYQKSLALLLPAAGILGGIYECRRFWKQVKLEKARLRMLTSDEIALVKQQLENAEEFAPGSRVYVTPDFVVTGSCQFSIVPLNFIASCEEVEHYLVATTCDGIAHILMAGRRGKKEQPSCFYLLKNRINSEIETRRAEKNSFENQE